MPSQHHGRDLDATLLDPVALRNDGGEALWSSAVANHAPPRAWTARLRDVFNAELTSLDEGHMKGLIHRAVREDADLDFKQFGYSNSDAQKRELAADIAAMANHRGGVIVIGIRDENDSAVECTPVEIKEGEEGRFRQIAASAIAPHVPFAIHIIESAELLGHGYYLIAIPPSPLRPHAVRKDRDLRYPRRDGPTKRWLSEAEVADLYRDRFRMATDQSDHVQAVIGEGLAAMDVSHAPPLLVVAAVPSQAGVMSVDFARLRAIDEWAGGLGRRRFWRGWLNGPPLVRVGSHRVRLATQGTGARPQDVYAELHADGSTFAAQVVGPARSRFEPPAGGTVLNSDLLWGLARALRLVGRHAVDHAGAWDDVLIEARLSGTELTLVYVDTEMGDLGVVEGAIAVSADIRSRHTLTLDAVAGTDSDLLAATHLVATELFHALGSAEIRQLRGDGAIRMPHVHSRAEIRQLAQDHGVRLTDEATH